MLVWPKPADVEAALHAFVRDLFERNPEVVRVGVFGSFGTTRWGVGSDVDLLVEVAGPELPPGQRVLDVRYRMLPVPADLLVLTTDQVTRMAATGARLIEEVRWLWGPHAEE